MSAEVRIPALGESVTEGVIVRWMKAGGDVVHLDEPLLELETDKASVEIPAPDSGVLEILKAEGAKVQVGEVVGRLTPGAAKARQEPAPNAVAPARAEPAATGPTRGATTTQLSPAVQRLVEENAIDPMAVAGTGRGGRLTKGDVLEHIEHSRSAEAPVDPVAPSTVAPVTAEVSQQEDERVPMSRLRQRIAERLVQAQHTAAILTTFNEVDMSAVLALRTRYKQKFTEKHGVALGFMSFFARACLAALEDFPLVGAQIEGTEIVYKKRVNLGIAVGTERGLVVPIVHGADRMSFAEIEKEIERLAGLARQNKLAINDLSGGTFTISNGGVYGSLMSTPILTPPQSAILGMHKTEKRAVVVDDQIVIRPMMYLALSYDHRLVDGKEAVGFLVRVKEGIEDPARLLLDL